MFLKKPRKHDDSTEDLKVRVGEFYIYYFYSRLDLSQRMLACLALIGNTELFHKRASQQQKELRHQAQVGSEGIRTIS